MNDQGELMCPKCSSTMLDCRDERFVEWVGGDGTYIATQSVANFHCNYCGDVFTVYDPPGEELAALGLFADANYDP